MQVYGTEFHPPKRILMGPGPSNVPESVLKAMSRPLLGHLDPIFVGLMDDIKEMLRKVFITENRMTFPVSGTGSAGMEFCFVNLIEPGDDVLVCVNGVFGERMADVAERCGATVRRVEAEWGRIIEPEQVEKAVREHAPKIVAVVHAETSTGALTPLEDISRIAHDAGALLLVDAVTSLAGCPVRLDEWNIDAVYSGTQKCLSCPPGLSPVSLSDRAMQAVAARKSKVRSWYLDVNLLANYWGESRAYHHTAPISMNYALHEALRLVLVESLERRWHRHQENHEALAAGLNALGFEFSAQEGHRLPQLNAVQVPDGVDEAALRQRLLNDFNIEIGGGLGPMKGKTLRIGLMGETSHLGNVRALLAALGMILGDMGRDVNMNEVLENVGH